MYICNNDVGAWDINQCPRVYNIILAVVDWMKMRLQQAFFNSSQPCRRGPNKEKLEHQFLQTMQVGGGAPTQKLAESQLTLMCKLGWDNEINFVKIWFMSHRQNVISKYWGWMTTIECLSQSFELTVASLNLIKKTHTNFRNVDEFSTITEVFLLILKFLKDRSILYKS